MKIDRRRFLRGASVNLALPAFASLNTCAEGRDTRDSARRFVCVASNYGMHPQGFFPSATGDKYQMSGLLEPLSEHRNELTVFSNLDHPGVGGGHGCSNTFLNGVEMKEVKDSPQRLHSLDELLGEKLGQTTRFSNMRLGANGFSWSRAGIRMPSESNPVSVYTRLFSEDTSKAKQQLRRFLSLIHI